MHVERPVVIKKLSLALFSAVGDGMHVEASVDSADPQQINEVLLTFREDESLGMQLVLHRDSGDLLIPLEELKRAIHYAEQEVHKESHYDLSAGLNPSAHDTSTIAPNP